MKILEVSGAVRPLYGSLGVRELTNTGLFEMNVGVLITCYTRYYKYTGLFKMIVGILTTCHTQHT